MIKQPGIRVSVFVFLFVLTAVSLAGQTNPFLSPPPEEEASFLSRMIQPPDQVPGGAPFWLRLTSSFQKTLRDTLADILSRPFSFGTLFLMLGVPFLYGLIHALGPGHRKTVIFVWFAGHPAPPLTAAGAGLFFALLHGGSASFLVLTGRWFLSGALARGLNQTSLYLEFFSYAALALTGIILMIVSLFQLRSIEVESGTPKSLWVVLFLSGLVPCPGAILVLLFSLAQGRVLAGLAAVLFMSLGMAVTLIMAGLAALGGRGIFARVGRRLAGDGGEERESLFAKIAGILSYLLIALFGLFLALPYINWSALTG